jgi:penicillin-binding protein 1B
VQVHFAGQRIEQLQVLGERDSLLRLEPMQIGGFYPAHNEDRILISLDQAPPLLVQALLAVEDRDFYQHWGVSLRGIARALIVNLQSGEMAQGGSTLTQQLVKNFYLSSERTLTRKVQEALMAVLLDLQYAKDDILEAYLNEIYLGQAGQRAIHGFGLASLFYFGQPLRELGAHQIALLVGIVKGASWYDPRRRPERALERRNQVLQLMAEQGVLTPAQAGAAQAEPLAVVPRPRYDDARYPAFLDLVKRQLKQDYREEDLRSEGLRIYTTLDPFVQESWEAAFDQRFAAMSRQHAARHSEVLEHVQGAAVVTDVNTGEVIALLGDRRSRFQGFNRALDARRPVGSLLKPMVVLTALDNGYTLGSLVDDSPFSVRLPHGQQWTPTNFDQQSHGKLPLQMALSNSYNQAFARLVWEMGTAPLVANLRRVGVEKDFAEVPAIALGAIDMSAIEVATLYQTLASSGFYTPLRAIRSVLDGNGNPLQRYGFDTEQRIPTHLTYLVASALQDAMRNGTGRASYQQLPDSLQLAGKTGTSDDQRDAWFAGWSGNYLGVVWLGHDDNLSTPLTGANAALPMWLAGMKPVGLQPLELVKPSNVEWVWIDPEQQARSKPRCDGAIYLPYEISTIPSRTSRCGETGGVNGWFRKWFGR